MLQSAPNGNLLKYDGNTGRIYLIWIVNLFLQLITLSIYRAWAKTRMRRYIYSRFSVQGDRFQYTGTGKELFIAFLKVYFMLFLFFLALGIVFTFGFEAVFKTIPTPEKSEIFSNVIVFAVILVLVYYAQFSAMRYRVSRTRWRGIRGTIKGRARTYVLYRLSRFIVNVLTLGYTIPRTDLIARKYIIDTLYLGNQRCSFDGDVRALDRINVITLLLAIPTLGFSRQWYRAALLRTQLEYMRAGTIHFKGTHTGKGLCWLMIGNLLLFFLTLGLGTPFAIQRVMRYIADNTYVLGDIESSGILQAKLGSDAMGEGMMDAMDDYDGLDLDMGII